ncbi:MAG TPA: hypothetical protein GX499_09805 [Clostridiales bacterium]|jgi:hypothetical protein|nr:hypothetical protein [Clostridiales bacterium]
MTWWQTVLYVLLFACISAVLYAWGMKKSLSQQDDLMRILINKASARVIKYLKKNKTISMAEIERQVANISARKPWSKQRATVANPNVFAQQVREHLLSQQWITFDQKSGQYHLNK